MKESLGKMFSKWPLDGAYNLSFQCLLRIVKGISISFRNNEELKTKALLLLQ
jgi:hypothetical protein